MGHFRVEARAIGIVANYAVPLLGDIIVLNAAEAVFALSKSAVTFTADGRVNVSAGVVNRIGFNGGNVALVIVGRGRFLVALGAAVGVDSALVVGEVQKDGNEMAPVGIPPAAGPPDTEPNLSWQLLQRPVS